MILVPAALPTSVYPYVALIAAGFVMGIVGHLTRSRPLILVGILIVGTVSVIVAFVVGKVGS